VRIILYTQNNDNITQYSAVNVDAYRTEERNHQSQVILEIMCRLTMQMSENEYKKQSELRDKARR
jgi:hypothetical protein